ncbi:phosphoribosylglycinamide formyltransferase, chloroplastic isoform X2 [Malania oleifera]|uniref:phosphoribosylglycinamide formyltransferase, chloroplastic isoform X2 n=1 Tax=Malania oleifera TaxID=397392 RepID=UPI0025AE0BB3|nr:phosphoribosylglycinamide formyltransferase, chloroplastic isoform X2 [Malania oleifera]
MEAQAQTLFPWFCTNSTIRPFQSPSKLFFSKLPPLSSSSSSSSPLPLPHLLQSQNRVSLRTHLSSGSHRVWSKNILQCRSTIEKATNFTGDGEDLKLRKKLAVFVSGGGSNFRSIHEASVRGSVYGDVVVLVTNKHDCGGAEYARHNGIPVILFPNTKGEPEGLSSSDLVAALRRFKVDFILLAGYLKLIPAELIQSYRRSILNIHPSLLPAFGGKGHYGMKVHKAVIASGARYSGPTIHFVDEHYDTGRILAQRVVPVLCNDTAGDLAARVLHEKSEVNLEFSFRGASRSTIMA